MSFKMLRQWRLQAPPLCLLCREEEDSIRPLFFNALTLEKILLMFNFYRSRIMEAVELRQGLGMDIVRVNCVRYLQGVICIYFNEQLINY